MFDTSELENITGRIAGIDASDVADDDLLAGVCSIATARRYLDAAETAILAELDARGTTDIVHGHRTANWLARETGIAPSSAKRRVRLANTLRTELPETAAAVREGRLCADRAMVMANATNERIASEFRDMEPSLIAESDHMTFPEWAQRVRVVAALLDQDGPEPAADINNNRLRLTGGVDGTNLTGVLVGDAAVTARHAIEQMADELWHQHKNTRTATNGEVDIPTRDTLRAMAFVELCHRGLMVDAHGSGTMPKIEATLVINADEPDVVYVNGEPLARGSETALACDLSVWAIVLNSLGVPLDMGREIRSANREQRRALKARDGGCVFPGCGMRPSHCDAHHVAHWYRDLGNTDVKHMVYLCRHHHGVIHRTGWSISIGDDGWSWITMPTGISLWCQRHGTVRAGPLPRAA